MEPEEFHLAQSRHKFWKTAHRSFVSELLTFPSDRDVELLRPPKAQTEEPAQPPARENPRRDNNRDRRKDK